MREGREELSSRGRGLARTPLPDGLSRSRAGWSLLDQSVSSGSNFLLLFLVIHVSSTVEVGAFGLAYTSFFLTSAAVRGLAMEPLLVRFASSHGEVWMNAAESATGLALSLAVLVSIPTLVVSIVLGGTMGTAFTALALMLPGLLLQDAWRLAFFSIGRAKAACSNDLVYLVVQLGAVVVLAGAGRLTMANLIFAWGGAAYAACLFGLCQSRLLPLPQRSLSWLREHKDIGPAFSADYIANRGAEQIALVAIGAISGLSGLGVITAARTFFAPLTTIQSGVNSFAIPELARLHTSGRLPLLRRATVSFGTTMAVLMILGGAVIALLPNSIGTALFHASWLPARDVLVPMTAFSAVNALGYGLWVGLRARQMAKPTLYARAVAGLLTIGTTSLGAYLSGASGAIWGMTAGAAIVAALLIALLARPASGEPTTNPVTHAVARTPQRL